MAATASDAWTSWSIAPWGKVQRAVLVGCVVVGAIVGPVRAAWVAAPTMPTFRGFHVPDAEYLGQPVKWARAYAKVEYPDLVWRPVRLEIQVAGADGVPAQGLPAFIRVNDRLLARFLIRPGWQRVDVVVERTASSTVVQFNCDGPPELQWAMGVGDIRIVPTLDAPGIVLHGALGAFVGLLVGAFLAARIVGPVGNAAGASAADAYWGVPARAVVQRAACSFIVLTLYLGAWAVLKPVMQAPDEPQHLLRANSVLRSRWTDAPSMLTLDPAFANPIAWNPPEGLGALFFHGERHLSRGDIEAMEQWPWQTPPVHWPTSAATYPAGYYGLVFALSEPLSAAWQLTPYQAVFVYRAWTVVLAAALWTVVYLALLSMPETRPHATALLALVVLNPMLAFVTSSVTPDAINNPLAALGLVLAYRTGVTGLHPWATTLALAACAFTKPSALLLFVGLAVGFASLWRSRRLPLAHAIPVTLAVGRAAVIALVGFYAWSPPRFVAGPPAHATLPDYLVACWHRIPEAWVMFWGKPGWLDYALPAIWYQLLFIIVIANAMKARQRDAPFARFTMVTFVTYAIVFAVGEFRWLALAGYNFQGRHLFPAVLGLGGLVMHDTRWLKCQLLAFLGAMSVAVALATVQRYFAGDWALVWAALP